MCLQDSYIKNVFLFESKQRILHRCQMALCVSDDIRSHWTAKLIRLQLESGRDGDYLFFWIFFL